MADLDIDSRAVIALGARYKGGSRIVQQELLSAMGGAVQDTKANVVTIIGGFSRTGKLAAATVTSVRQTRSRVEGRVHNTAPYAHWVDQGRGRVIPRLAKVLRWISRGGDVVFSMRAGPFAGHHFMRKGLEQSRPQIFRRFERAAERIAARLVGRG